MACAHCCSGKTHIGGLGALWLIPDPTKTTGQYFLARKLNSSETLTRCLRSRYRWIKPGFHQAYLSFDGLGDMSLPRLNEKLSACLLELETCYLKLGSVSHREKKPTALRHHPLAPPPRIVRRFQENEKLIQGG